jgi:hypothetical protein
VKQSYMSDRLSNIILLNSLRKRRREKLVPVPWTCSMKPFLIITMPVVINDCPSFHLLTIEYFVNF